MGLQLIDQHQRSKNTMKVFLLILIGVIVFVKGDIRNEFYSTQYKEPVDPLYGLEELKNELNLALHSLPYSRQLRNIVTKPASTKRREDLAEFLRSLRNFKSNNLFRVGK